MSELKIDQDEFKKDIELQKIKEEVVNKLKSYRKTLSYLASDAPISILCLPKNLEKILSDSGLLRVYDLFDIDFAKIERIDASGVRNLTASINQFLAML